MTSSMCAPDGQYGLARPDLAHARAAVLRIMPGMVGGLWPQILDRAGLTGDETDPESFDRLLAAMSADAERVVALCARSLSIRLSTHLILTSHGLAPARGGGRVSTGEPSNSRTGLCAQGLALPRPGTAEPPRQARPAVGIMSHLDALADVDRLTAVARIDLTNPHLVARLDEITHRCRRRFGFGACSVSIVLDTAKLILSSSGLTGWVRDVGGAPIEWSFCGHTVATGRPYVVADAAVHPAHRDSPLATRDGVRSYAGVPLVTREGHILGAHCVMSPEPHEFTADEIAELQDAASVIVCVLTEYVRDPASAGLDRSTRPDSGSADTPA